jgi:peptidoglycan/LPS O-acetylase OafA/YrhL
LNDKILYFNGLNGLRAIAAIAVVISHITISLPEFKLDPYIFGSAYDGSPQRFTLAGYGVSVFFVLSGFLITFLLQSEKDIQPIEIKKFYIRRILRIWPLYYLYLIVSLIVIIGFDLNFNDKSFLLYIFYAANIPFILDISLPLLAHYWSLGVEEQFYLFWPWIVKKTNHLTTYIIVLIVLLIGVKMFLHIFYPGSLLEAVIHVARFHCMMIGALGAIIYKRNNLVLLNLIDNKVIQIGCWITMLLVAVNIFHVASVIDNEIISIVTLLIIIGQVNIKNRIVNLETRAFNFLGKISYGIYVIHPLMIFFFIKILKNVEMSGSLKYLTVYGCIIGCTILISYLSFTFFEKHFLKIKEKFVVVQSSSSNNN